MDLTHAFKDWEERINNDWIEGKEDPAFGFSI